MAVKDFIRINPADNVCVALRDIRKGEELQVDGVTLRMLDDIPVPHKFAVCDIAAGSDVIKYGYPIGHATADIKAGQYVGRQNLATNLSGLEDYGDITLGQDSVNDADTIGQLTFRGYVRPDGQVGIRNEIWVIPTVGCVNGIVSRIVERFNKETGAEGVDGIYGFTHNYGCSQLGDDHQNTRRILRDMVLHPNAGGVLVVGLGCENNVPADFERFCGDYDRNRVKFMVCQDVEGDEVEHGLRLLAQLYDNARKYRREEVSLSKLRIGLKCGGSDGLSGITANPLVGRLTDFVCRHGATAVLTEVPEMFGAEKILMRRCSEPALVSDMIAMINDCKRFFIDNGQPVSENPSPGNVAGGITTLEEKSLGCVQKGGAATVSDVLKYGERVKTAGLNVLAAPGNDLVASTALAAAGCQMVLFTTGRGTPFATFVPTLKISSNSELASAKTRWIDFNAGTLVEDDSPDSALERLVRLMLDVADGRKVKSEVMGIHDFAIFKSGVTL